MGLTRKQLLFTVTAFTPLGQAAANLSAGESAAFGDGFCPLIVGGGTTNMSFAHWSMAWHYDPIRMELQALGKNASSGGGDGRIRHAIYSEVDNAWRSIREWGDDSVGHVYSAHTIDPATGDHYYIQGGAQSAQRYERASDAWISNTSTASGSWGTSPNNLTAWHPNLFGSGVGGLVSLARSRSVYFWSKASNSWSSTSVSTLITVNTREGGAIYSPALDAVVCGGGDGTNDVIRVNSNSSIAEIAAAPTDFGSWSSGGDHAALTAHPVSGKPMLLQRGSSSEVWIYEAGSNSWDLQGYTHPFNGVSSSDGPSNSPVWIPCPIPPYSVVAGLCANSDDTCDFYLWKPA